MTVGYLKEQLENYPDDARVILDSGPIHEIEQFAKDHDGRPQFELEVIDMYSIQNLPKIVLLQTRSDFDYMNELKAKTEYLKDFGGDNWKEILLEQGFTENEIDYAMTHRPVEKEVIIHD